jgi:hypothetical protein
MVNNRKQKNILLAVLLLLLFSFPIISIANKSTLVGGIPRLYLYVGLVWFISLILLVILAERKPFNKIKKTAK